ncbi:MAG: DUF4291 domain-containing protein [Aureispira sp.]|nr:DUF4291 domain-containing protein [Aureispira sp.]
MKKLVYAASDDEGVWVYQAFRPKIVEYAVQHGTFGKGFGLDRMSWIKPSLGWMLRRSKYATKHRMTAIAKIKLSHQGWLELLRQSIPTHFDANLFETEHQWQKALNNSHVIHQWDPERDLQGKRLQRQAIQIGLRADALLKYVQDYIIGVEDITDLALEIGKVAKLANPRYPKVPIEVPYALPQELMQSLSCSLAD